MTTLEGAVVVVAGGGDGVGRGIATECAGRGALVHIASNSDASAAVAAIRDAGGRAEWHEVDVTDYPALEGLASALRERHAHVDVLVNSASSGAALGGVDVLDPDQVSHLFDVMITGVFNATRAFAGDLVRSAGEGRPAFLLNVGSEHSLGVPPHVPPMSAYTAAKYATLGLTAASRRDLGAAGVGVSLLAPGWVLTEKVVGMIAHSAEMRAAIEPLAQPTADVARMAIDGLLERRYVIATNPSTRSFALDHAREIVTDVQRLPLSADGTPGGAQDDAANCPVVGSR